MNTRTAAWLAWSIAALQVALIVLHWVLEGLALSTSTLLGTNFVIEALVGGVSILAFPLVGALIASRRPEHPVGWIFCAANLGWVVNNFAGSYARYALVANPGSLPLPELMVWLYTWPGNISVGLYVFVTLLFPDGRLPSPRWRPFVWLVVGFTVASTLAAAFAAGPVDDTIGFEVGNPLGVQGPIGGVLAWLSQLMFVWALLLLVSVISLILRLYRAKGPERQQLKWFTSAGALNAIFIAGLAVLVARYGSPTRVPGWAQPWVQAALLSDVLIPIAAGIAILKYRLYDIDLIIRRTLVYSVLTAMLALAYFGGVVVLQRIFVSLTGQGQNQLVTVLSTLALAALFAPLRRRVQDGIDRRFYRKKYDAAKTLAAFAATVRDETDLDKLTASLINVVQETMQPEHVSLWLKDSNAKPAPSHGDASRNADEGTPRRS